MRIPIGVEYTSNVEGEVSLPFSCGTCNHEAIAFVRAKGTGDATAYAFIGMGSAKERASTAASQDLVNRANQMIQAAKCPGCGARDGSALARMQARARNSIVGYFIGGIVIAFVLPTSVGWINGVMPFVGLLLGYFNYSSAAWQWTEVDQRVRFSSADEEAEVIAEAVTGLVGDWRPGFRWGEDAKAKCVKRQFRPGLALALISLDDDGPSWLEPAELKGMSEDGAFNAVLLLLEATVREGLVKVAPGVFQATWGDELAASRLAVPSAFAELGVFGPVVAFTPTEDTLFLAGAEDTPALLDAFDRAREHARATLANKESAAGRFTATPWILENGVFVPWWSPSLEKRVSELAAELGATAYRPS